MRLDKFLKVSRLVKRRTVAKELCDAGRAEVNGRAAKAGTEVNAGDTLTLRFGQKTTHVRIEKVMENARKEQSSDMYTVLRGDLAGIEEGDEGDDPDE